MIIILYVQEVFYAGSCKKMDKTSLTYSIMNILQY